MFSRIQEERQERRKVRQELGIVEDPARKTRFNSPEPVATGVSMGIKPTATSMLTILNKAKQLICYNLSFQPLFNI